MKLQLLKYSDSEKHTRNSQQQGGQGHVLNMDNFIDTTNIEGRFEFSEYVRGYGKYLDEQLEVYARINFYLVSLVLLLPQLFIFLPIIMFYLKCCCCAS